MKYKYLILLAAIVLIAPTYNDGVAFNFNGYEHNITRVVGDRAIVDTDYGTFFLRENGCVQFDTHRWCTTNITEDIVEYYPHEAEIIVEQERLCGSDTCKSYGVECDSDTICIDYCVNGICRPEQVWCGDGVCDEGESCVADCPQQAPQNISVNQSNTTTQDTEIEQLEKTAEQTAENITTETQNATENVSVQTQENTTEEVVQNTTETQQASIPPPPSRASSTEINWVGAGITIFGGIVIIFVIFNKKRKRKKELELYSYRK